MATEEIYREANRRSHKLLGTYLALWAWVHQVNCVVLSRSELLRYLGLKAMRDKRIDWLGEDVKNYFPHATPLRYRTHVYSTLYLSRLPFPEGTFGKSMMDCDRVELLNSSGFRAAFVEIPPENEVVATLARVIHGLGDFPVTELD